MQFRLRLSTVGVLLALSLLTIPGLAGAQDPAGSRITLALGALPEVESYEVDDSGHLVELAGRLTQVGPSPPHRVAVAFLEIHRNLYPKAPGTTFTVESMTGFDAGSVINVRQWVGGFEALGDPVACRFDADGVLVGISGVVLHRGDVAPVPEHPITEEEAYDVAVAAAWPGNVPVDKLPFLHSFAGTRVLHESQPRRAAWRVEMVEMRGKAAFRFTVMVDAATGAALSVDKLDVTPMLEHFPGQGQTAAESTGLAAEAKTLLIDPGPECQEADPANPPGDFTTYQGFAQWTASRFEKWIFKNWAGVTEFTTHLVEEYSFQRSHISRSGVPTPDGYTRLTFRFPDLSDTMKIKVCWGAMEAHCATLLGVEPVGPYNPNDTLGTFVFDDNDEWKASTSKDLVAYFTRSPLGNDSPITGDISRIELWSGPLLEFNLEPRLLNTYGDVPHSYGAGAWMTVNQSVFNAGCDMYETYSSNDIRAATYTLYKIESGARVPGSEIEVCSNAMATGTLQSGMSAFLNMCNIILPEAGLNDENVGLWELEGVFDTFPQGNPPAFRFELLDHGIPNLIAQDISATRTIAGGEQERPGWLMRYEPYDISVDVRSEEYPTEQPVTAELWVRNPTETTEWTLAGEETVPGISGHDPVTFPDVIFGEEFLPFPRPWATMDVWVEVDPDNTVEEFDEGGNTLYVENWITVSHLHLDQAVGETILFTMDDFEEGDDIGEPWGDPGDVPDVLKAMWTNPMGSYIVTRPELATNEGPPRAAWLRDEAGLVTVEGIMIRYRRNFTANRESPHLDAGYDTCHYVPGGGQDGDDLIIGPGFDLPLTARDMVPDDMWRVLVWQGDDINDVEPTVLDNWTHVLQGLDSDCIEGLVDLGDGTLETACVGYPTTEIDFIRAWAGEGEIEEPDFTPTALVYYDQGVLEWLLVQDPVPQGGEIAQLGIRVHNGGTAAGSVEPSGLIVGRTDPGAPEPVTLVPSVTDPVAIGAGSDAVIPLKEELTGLEPWTPVVLGSHQFLATVTHGDPNPLNDTETFFVQVVEATWDLRPAGFVYLDGSEWRTLPGTEGVAAASGWELGLRVVNDGTVEAPLNASSIHDVTVDGAMWTPVDPEEEVTVGAGESVDIALQDPSSGTEWAPGTGTHQLTATVSQEFDPNETNNTGCWEIEIVEELDPCSTYFVGRGLPVECTP